MNCSQNSGPFRAVIIRDNTISVKGWNRVTHLQRQAEVHSLKIDDDNSLADYTDRPRCLPSRSARNHKQPQKHILSLCFLSR